MKGEGVENRAAVGSALRADRDGWRKVRLGEIADCTLGKMLDHKKNHGTPRPYLANYNVRWGSFDLSDVSLMPFEDAELEKYRLHKGDLVVCEGGEIGRCALWRDDNLEMFIQKAIHRVRVHTDVCSAAYLYYWFLNSGRSDYFKQFTTGATILHLPRQNLIAIPVDLPPLPIQRKIAEILGAYDDLIENNRRRIELLEKMARELYRERFVRRAGKGSELTLLEVFDFVRGKSYASNEIDVAEGVPMVNLKNIRAWGGYNPGAERLFSGDYKEEQTLGRGDVIMGVTDMTQDRRIVGHVALVPTLDQTATFSMDIIKLIPKGMSNVELYSILQYSGVSKEISQLATGATVLHLRPNALDSVRIWIPRKADFEKVEGLFSGCYSEIDNLVLQNRNLSRQRDRLLPRLLSGKIDLDKLVKEEGENG